MESIIHYDQQLFLWIQQHCHSELLDVIMPWLRNKYSWFPLYIFLIIALVYRYRKTGVLIVTTALLCVFCSDICSSKIAKPIFKRIRPCADQVIGMQFTPLIKCGDRGYSFTSSHAANHFAIAFGLSLFFYKRKKWLLYLGIFWAGAIALAQVYVGVHYPLDIAFGALLGGSIAIGIHAAINKYFKPYFKLND